MLRTFHSISRSRSVAAISNDTDPDGKTKILTKLRVKLPYRNVADIMGVKVDNDGAKANILPLHTFRSMFPHKLDEDELPKRRCPQRIESDAPMLWQQQIGQPQHHHPSTEAFTQKIHFRTTNSSLLRHQCMERDHHRTPSASVRLGFIQVLCKNHVKTMSSIKADQTNNLFRVHNIDGMTQWSKQSSSEPEER